MLLNVAHISVLGMKIISFPLKTILNNVAKPVVAKQDININDKSTATP